MNNYLDFFTNTALIEAVAGLPYVPSQLSSLFETRSLPGTQLALEEQVANTSTLMTATARGTPAKAPTMARRKVHTFTTAHYRHDGAVYADEVLNARAAGTDAVGELIVQRRDQTLAVLRQNLDYTLEYLRMSCLLAPGNAFGSIGTEQTIAFQTDATKTRGEIFTKIIKPLETALGGVPFTGVHVWCSDGIWDDVIENKAIKDTYIYTQQAQALRGDTRDVVTWGGVTFERYRGAGSAIITTDKAVVVPTGVPAMFLQGFAPADTLDAVGSGALGSPYYTQAYPIDDGNRGWSLEMQTNPVMVCTRPAAVFFVKMA